MIGVILLLIGPLGSLTASADCSTIDMRGANQSMQGTQPMCQGAQGTCYAYTAAAMADAWARSHLTPPVNQSALDGIRPTSPTPLAASTRIFKRASRGATQSCNNMTGTCGPGDGLDGGNVEDCLKYLGPPNNGAACDHRQVFGESEVSYDFNRVQLDADYHPGDLAQPMDQVITERRTRRGLGSGGNFGTGRTSRFATRDGEVFFAGRDSDYLTRLNAAWDSYLAQLHAPTANEAEVARLMSRQLTCSLQEVGLPAAQIPGSLVDNTNEVLRRIFADSAHGNRQDFLNRYFAQACQGHTYRIAPDIPKPTVTDYRLSTHKHDQAALLQAINTSLERPRGTPVSISFCSTVLKNPSRVALASRPLPGHGVTNGGTASASDDLTMCREGETHNGMETPDASDHAALIMGRKQGPNGCMFLVRNSWGQSCERYLSDQQGFECEPATGDIWVDQNTLANVIYETVELR
ncbi:MAG TPA: hypothetical protein VL588_05750 [Bdellovibrionota bacterium]|nr:hypothetical protein [Bdellovibrionota bacterium]